MAPKGNKNAVGNKGGREITHTFEYISKIAREMEEWADKPDSLFIEQFTANHKDPLYKETFKTWAERHPEFAYAYHKVRGKCLNRIKLGSMTKGYDGNFAAKILPLIDEDYRNWRREELKLQAEGESSKEIRLVVDYDRKPEK